MHFPDILFLLPQLMSVCSCVYIYVCVRVWSSERFWQAVCRSTSKRFLLHEPHKSVCTKASWRTDHRNESKVTSSEVQWFPSDRKSYLSVSDSYNDTFDRIGLFNVNRMSTFFFLAALLPLQPDLILLKYPILLSNELLDIIWTLPMVHLFWRPGIPFYVRGGV